MQWTRYSRPHKFSDGSQTHSRTDLSIDSLRDCYGWNHLPGAVAPSRTNRNDRLGFLCSSGGSRNGLDYPNTRPGHERTLH